MVTYYFHTPFDSVGKNRRKTIAGILNEDSNQLLLAYSECSKKDQFNRKRGRIIAQGRAMKNPHLVVNLTSLDKKEVRQVFLRQAIEMSK
jgi:uncharacterized DUF497 family protein